MWLQVEEIATTDFLLVEKVHVAFSNFIRNIPLSRNTNQKLDMFSDGRVRTKDHVLVSKFQIFDHPLADVLDEIIFLRKLGDVIVRKRNVGCFFGK